MSDLCEARSRLTTQSNDSYFICTLEPGHAGAHSACDGRGHVLARWLSGRGPVEVFGPWGRRFVGLARGLS